MTGNRREIINLGHGRLAMTPEEETHRRAEIRANAEQYVTDCLAILGQQMPAARDFVAIVHKVEEPVLRAWGLKP